MSYGLIDELAKEMARTPKRCYSGCFEGAARIVGGPLAGRLDQGVWAFRFVWLLSAAWAIRPNRLSLVNLIKLM